MVRHRWLLLFAMFALAPVGIAQAPPSDPEAAGLTAEQAGEARLALDDYVAALQALPEPPPADVDRRLRERIIKVALKLSPPPGIPDEAQQWITNGETSTKSAQNSGDIQTAVSEFQRALRIAPWLAGAYFNLGDLQEKLRDYSAAVRSFELYLLAAPAAQDAESIKERIADLRCRFPAMYLQTHSILTQSALRPAWAMDSDGELTVSNGSIQFRDTGKAKHSFVLQIAEVRSLERRSGPQGFRVLRITLQNGKKFDLVPDPFIHMTSGTDRSAGAMEAAMDEGVDAMEKAIKVMASQHGIVLQ